MSHREEAVWTAIAGLVLAEAPLVDGHNDLPYALRVLAERGVLGYDMGARQSATHTDLVRLGEGGVGGQFWSVYVPSHWAGERAVTGVLEQIDLVHALIARHRDRLALARTAAEVEAARAAGKVASLLGAEGGHSIAESLGVLRILHALGVRYLTLTHNDNVPWADSATDTERLGGLSGFGHEVVREMNRIGMIVDLSHVSVGTMHDALATTDAPVLFSHSSARALVGHPRNVPDDILAALPVNGGVCMVTFVPAFVSTACWDWERQPTAGPRPRASLAQVADHVDHVREVAGVGHVGIGGDFDGCDAMPAGLEDVSRYPVLIAELAARGWSRAELAALVRENVLRVLHDVEVTAANSRL